MKSRGKHSESVTDTRLRYGSAWLSGFNLYATMLMLGLLQPFHLAADFGAAACPVRLSDSGGPGSSF